MLILTHFVAGAEAPEQRGLRFGGTSPRSADVLSASSSAEEEEVPQRRRRSDKEEALRHMVNVCAYRCAKACDEHNQGVERRRAHAREACACATSAGRSQPANIRD